LFVSPIEREIAIEKIRDFFYCVFWVKIAGKEFFEGRGIEISVTYFKGLCK
jgi:hypothetical protein